MRSLAYALSPLPGFASPKTYAAWPVWHDSTTKEVRFVPMSRKQAAKHWQKARRFDRQTHTKGKHGGRIGRTALAVLYALLFDFLDFKTGQLDPSYHTIADQGRRLPTGRRYGARPPQRPWLAALAAPLAAGTRSRRRLPPSPDQQRLRRIVAGELEGLLRAAAPSPAAPLDLGCHSTARSARRGGRRTEARPAAHGAGDSRRRSGRPSRHRAGAARPGDHWPQSLDVFESADAAKKP